MVFGRGRSKSQDKEDDKGKSKSHFGSFANSFASRSKSNDREKSKTKSLIHFDEEEYRNDPKFECRVCGRLFVKSALKRHEPVCQKSHEAKRKVFDSGKQRAQDSDIPISSVRHRQRDFVKRQGKYSPPKTRWKEKSSQVRTGAKQGRQIKEALKTGGPLPEMERSKTPDDFVKCQYCGRKFNEHAAERHVPYCKKKNDGKKQKKVADVKKGGSRSKSYSSSRSKLSVKDDSESDSKAGGSKSRARSESRPKKKGRSQSPKERKAKPKSASRVGKDKADTRTRISRR